MLRKIALILLPVALLLAVACDSDDKGSTDNGQDDTTPAVSDETPEPTEGDDGEDSGARDGSGGAALLSSVSPFELLGSIGQPSTSAGDVDPTLAAALLQEDDLPSDYTSLGDFSYSMSSEFGDIDMAATMFMKGDAAADEMGSTVMSAVMALPPEALDELGDPSELSDISEDDLAQLEDVQDLGLAEFDILDGSSLGDGGVGMHMVMDFGGLLGALGASDDELESAGIAMDMYMFVRGENMLMVMTMWPTGEESGVDALDLAEIMDGRAG